MSVLQQLINCAKGMNSLVVHISATEDGGATIRLTPNLGAVNTKSASSIELHHSITSPVIVKGLASEIESELSVFLSKSVPVYSSALSTLDRLQQSVLASAENASSESKPAPDAPAKTGRRDDVDGVDVAEAPTDNIADLADEMGGL